MRPASTSSSLPSTFTNKYDMHIRIPAHIPVSLINEAIQAYLSEAVNLFSDTELKKAIHELVLSADTAKEIKDWFDKQFIKGVRNDDSYIQFLELVKHEWKEGDPAWAKGDNVYSFKKLPREAVNTLNHWVDFFNTYSEQELKSLYKETLSTIEKKVKEWDEEMKKKSEKAKKKDKGLVADKDYKFILKGKTGSWVKLLTKAAFKCEGDSMGHCVGGYDPEDADIYSLWDNDGEPHVTIEANDKEKTVSQIKGKGNAAPVERYVADTIAFIDHLKYEVVGDGENVGMIEYDGKYYIKDSEAWKKIHKEVIQPRIDKAFADIRARIREV